MCRIAVVAVCATLAALGAASSPAAALTVYDEHTRTLDVEGAGCETKTYTVTLPARTRTARLVAPKVGDELTDSVVDQPTSTVVSARIVRRGGRRVARMQVRGAPVMCAGGQQYEWESSVGIEARITRDVRVYFPQVCCGGRHDHEPGVLYIGASFRLYGARWSAWGGRTARGTATVPYNDCRPSCAEGGVTEIPAQVRLTRPRRCNGVYQYLTLTYTMTRQPPAGPRRVRSNFGFRCE